MRTVLLASILLVPPAAFAAVPAPSPAAAAASADPDERARQLLRAVRLKAESGAGDETALRDQAKELGAAADGHGRDLARLAGSYLDLLDAGQPLPPPSPDELADAADDDVDPSGRAAARAQAAADSRAAAQKTAAMLDQVSGAATNLTAAASAPFDGATKRASVAVEVEPAPGYHTVNADDFLTQTDDASRQDVMIAATAELLAKAARKNVGGEHAISLGRMLTSAIAGDPMFRSMTALRVRVRPDGKLVIVYRLTNGVVVEKELGMTLDEGSSVSSVSGAGGARRRRKRRAASASGQDGGGDADGQGDGGGKHSHAKAPGAPDFGDGGDAGSIGAGGAAGAGRSRGEFGDGGGADIAADDGGAGGAGDDARSGGVVDPDGAPAAGRAKRASSGAAGSGAPSVSVPGGFTTASGPGDAAPGDGAAAGADAAAAPGPRRAKGSAGADEIPALPRLSGDLSGGRGFAGAPAVPASATATVSAARATAPANSVAASGPAGTPASAAPGYEAASDGPLRDAVAASPVIAPPAAKPGVAPTKDAAESRSAAAPAALLLASAALGGLGVFLLRSQS